MALLQHGVGPAGDRFQASGHEAGTAPGDRSFRPDVEGLRAVAVLLVVLYHAGVPGLGGGYVGVDVFFVISGFVITGLLLRERASRGQTSILSFYGRRCRRIIPAASLVIVATVLLSYLVLGAGTGGSTATDGRWAAIFLANFHFSSIGTNYLSAQRPPSLLQNYWSLSVEEQFYIVYPTFFLILAGLRTRLSLRARLAIGLCAVIAASFIFSVVQTSSNSTVAYFSPLTRAWELALGALVAVGTGWLLKLPPRLAADMTWVGLGAIGVAAFAFNGQTQYPGSLVAIPVVGAALIIAGGVVAQRAGAEAVLGLTPFRTLGKLSYSLYLWHWPILALAAQHAGKTALPASQNVVWIGVALVASVITYRLVENPIRHARTLTRYRWSSVGLGVALTLGTLGLITAQVAWNTAASGAAPRVVLSPAQVGHLVATSSAITSVPADLSPKLSEVQTDIGIPTGPCWPAYAWNETSVPACAFGDRHSSETMVLYGDSHAAMWFKALDDIAKRAGWRLVLLAKGACPVDMLPYADPEPGAPPGTKWAACDKWHQFAIKRINRLQPNLLIVTQRYHGYQEVGGANYTGAQWRQGLESFFRALKTPQTRMVVLGSTPDSLGPQCLGIHGDDVQACSVANDAPSMASNVAERAAAGAVGARYVDVTPWFCSTTCSGIIGRYAVYWDTWHITATYSRALEGVLARALDLPVPA